MISLHFHNVTGGKIWAQTAKNEQNCSIFLLLGAITRTYAFRENYKFCLMSFMSSVLHLT